MCKALRTDHLPLYASQIILILVIESFIMIGGQYKNNSSYEEIHHMIYEE